MPIDMGFEKEVGKEEVVTGVEVDVEVETAAGVVAGVVEEEERSSFGYAFLTST